MNQNQVDNKIDNKTTQGNDKLAQEKGVKISLPKLHTKVEAKTKEAEGIDAFSLPNRIGLMLDVSPSMNEHEGYAKSKLEYLADAMAYFIQSCNFKDTSLAVRTFPSDIRQDLSCEFSQLMLVAMGIRQTGSGTPMGIAMSDILQTSPITRGIIMSDGEATDANASLKEAKNFKEAEIPVDCVHIGQSKSGEERLIQIAEITGGIYFKFKDIQSFAKSFAFLTPAKRGQLALMEKNDILRLTGAEDFRK